MEKKIIRKSIDINTPREQVWEVLLNDRYMRIWSSEFSEGSHAETDWKVGSKAVFTDDTNNGIIGRVLENRPPETIAVEFTGMVLNGKEDYDSEMAQEVIGGREIYVLTEKNGVTHLAIESTMPEKYFESMSEAWDRALLKIEELSLSLTEKVR